VPRPRPWGSRKSTVHAATAAGHGQAAAEWTPELFDAHQNQTVISLVISSFPTDTAGAKAALVNRHIDHILAAAPEDEKTRFRERLWWVGWLPIRKPRQAVRKLHGGSTDAISERWMQEPPRYQSRPQVFRCSGDDRAGLLLD